MKNLMILFGAILTGILILVSCGQNNSSDNNSTSPINSEINDSNPKINRDESNSNLDDDFEIDAQEMGRLLCLESKARENNDDEEHDRIEGEKMLLKQEMLKKYKELIGKKEYDEKYKYNEEIGRKICFKGK